MIGVVNIQLYFNYRTAIIQMPETKAYLVSNSVRTDLTHNQTTIGRLTSNLIALNDPTVSKNHAGIYHHESKFYICDFNTVNGTFLNGNKLEPNKKYQIKHKDSIQFGKYPHLFCFYQSNPEHQKKGKINLKEYCFELDSDEEVPQQEKKESKVQPNNSVKLSVMQKQAQINIPSSLPSKQGRPVKIPNLEDYLELEGSLLSSNPSVPVIKTKESRFGRDPKVELPSLKDEFNEEQLSKLRSQQQKRRNLFLEKQAQRQARQQKARSLQQQKIRLQIQRHKQQEQMLRRQLELEAKIRQEQEQMQMEKKRIQQQLLTRQRERRQQERKAELDQKQKERRFIEQLKQEKEAELQEIKQQQESLRTKNEAAMREELETRKKELESQAQALARQYEQIYRETIRKMKNDIEKQEAQISDLEANIEKNKDEQADLEVKVKQVAEAVEFTQKQYDQISGRNKAFILYASELQNKLDKLKEARGSGGPSNNKKGSFKARQDIESSRKLLSMKRGELKSLQDQISKLRLSLTLDKRMGHTDMLETILSNHQAIQNSKYVYFEYLREEKALQELWQLSLEENEHLQNQNNSLQKDIQQHKKELISNLRDNASRLTEQRLHMLKCLHYLPEQKKRAAKLLIQEMVTMQQEIRNMVAESQTAHDQIFGLIVESQRNKNQNEYLSQLLFGADSMAHHFDNMKIEINELIQRIELERDEGRVAKRLKLSEQIENNQLKIFQASRKLETLKNRWREGLRGQKVLLAEKNPIVFFGDLLANKQNELQALEHTISQLQRECSSINYTIEELQRKKNSLSDNLQSFKRDEIARIRNDFV